MTNWTDLQLCAFHKSCMFLLLVLLLVLLFLVLLFLVLRRHLLLLQLLTVLLDYFWCRYYGAYTDSTG